MGIIGPTAIDGITEGIDSGLPPHSNRDVEDDDDTTKDDPNVDDLSESAPPTPVTANARRSPTAANVTVEEHKFPSDLLTIERERLKIERRRLEIEEERLQMERERHNAWKTRNAACVNQNLV